MMDDDKHNDFKIIIRSLPAGIAFSASQSSSYNVVHLNAWLIHVYTKVEQVNGRPKLLLPLPAIA